VSVDIATFRMDYPEFSSTTAYPDSGVTYWLKIAGLLLNTSRWQDMLDVGTELFVAHNLVLERQANKSAANGAAPGVSTGPVSSKTVGPVTQAYDTTAAIEPDAGHWNLTTYGTRFINLVRMFGAGPIQVT
jgi:uncharacterized protein DUF4054